MSDFSATIQSADWKVEKHAPSIEAPETVKAGETFTVSAGLGTAIAHPNTVKYYIGWISLFSCRKAQDDNSTGPRRSSPRRPQPTPPAPRYKSQHDRQRRPD